MDNASMYLKEAKAELEKAEISASNDLENLHVMYSIANSLISIAHTLCKGVIETSEVEK